MTESYNELVSAVNIAFDDIDTIYTDAHKILTIVNMDSGCTYKQSKSIIKQNKKLKFTDDAKTFIELTQTQVKKAKDSFSEITQCHKDAKQYKKDINAVVVIGDTEDDAEGIANAADLNADYADIHFNDLKAAAELIEEYMHFTEDLWLTVNNRANNDG